MTTTGNRKWQPGPAKVWDGKTAARRPNPGPRGDDKVLARADASLAESERRVSRQIAVLGDLRAAGLVTTEAEKSLIRLEAAVLEQRSSREMLVSKSSNEVETAGGAPQA